MTDSEQQFTQQDLVRSIGDVLTELDVLMADPELEDTDFMQIRRLRRQLDDQQRSIVAASFRENTKKFQAAAKQLDTVNADLEKTIADVAKIVQTIAAVTSLISVAAKVLTMAVK